MILQILIYFANRYASKSPVMFKRIQWLSGITVLIAGTVLALSEFEVISFGHQGIVNEYLKGLVYSGIGTLGTAGLTVRKEEGC
jgi:hypothetical protein